jgi:hypothetical protein
VTLAAAPGVGAPVTVTCETYRLVRLESLDWSNLHANWWSSSIEMIEVLGATG